MTSVDVPTDPLLDAHDESPAETLDGTVERALALYGELENPEEMLDDVDLESDPEPEVIDA